MFVHQKTFMASVGVAAGLMFAAAGYAQTASPAPPSGRPGAGATSGLNLTDAQRDQVRMLREAQRKDSQALREKLRTARQQLQQAMRADVPDEQAVRSAAGAVAALRADGAALRARSRAQFMKMLTPEQQARMKQARARAAQRAQRAMRAQRPLMRRDQMMYRNRMMRQQYYRWWRGWI
jgi:Spy/CpxP family protein refolding chaperone